MSSHITDIEQVDRIKEFIKEYGTTIILAVVAVMILSYGWQYWQRHQEDVRMQASVGYETMLANVANHNSKAAQLQATYLMKEFPKTPYAPLAALLLAREQVNAGDLAQAQISLQWVMAHAKTTSLRQIARNRSARILLSQNQAQPALDLLQTVDDEFFKPQISALQGDAYVLLNKLAEAKSAYQAAIQGMTDKNPNFTIIRMKLANLNEVANASPSNTNPNAAPAK